MNRFEMPGSFSDAKENKKVQTPEDLGIDLKYAAPEYFEEGGPLYEWAKHEAEKAYKNFLREQFKDVDLAEMTNDEINKLIRNIRKTNEGKEPYKSTNDMFLKYFGYGEDGIRVEDEVIEELRNKESEDEQAFAA